MARIRIIDRQDPIDIPQGCSLLVGLQKASHPISTSCGGQAICGLCRITVLEGKHLLSPVNAEEVKHLGNVAKVVNIRLACQAIVLEEGDATIDVPPVVDVAAKKREQNRRGFAERAARRQSGAGTAPMDRSSQPRIEWRPRKLEK
jgi:2Fe-2S ferredoxin